MTITEIEGINLVAYIYILLVIHLHMVFTWHKFILFDHVGSKFLLNLPKIYPVFGNICKLFEMYELEKRYRGILFYSFQYLVTWPSFESI